MPKQDHSQVPLPSPHQARRIETLTHKVQSGIAFFEGRRDAFGERCSELEPKHLRVGVNSALVEASALAALLFRKGLFTAEEYYDALIETWEREVDSYQSRVKAIHPSLNI